MFGQPKNQSPKPLAALSSTLLARKGQASPAMRRQGYGGFGAMAGAPDDLGWNDMGDPTPPTAPVPPVLVEREALHDEVAQLPPFVMLPDPEPEIVEPAEIVEPVEHAASTVALRPVSVATAARLERETAKTRGKAAFTLRLDPERHLRLRIASALHNASAQMLVTDALDRFLHAMPEVEALVAQIPPRGARSTRPRSAKGK